MGPSSVISAIKTVALVYQHQRQKDNSGRVIAEISDYAIAYQLVNESFRESLSIGTKSTDQRIRLIKKHNLITPRDLANMVGVSGPAILTWCDEKGQTLSIH